MIVWNVNALAGQLKDGSLPEREKMKYFFVFIVLLSATSELLMYLAEPVRWEAVATSVTSVLGTAAGTYFTYLINRRGDDREFITRSICLFIPVAVRTFVVWLPLIIAYILIGSLVGGDAFDAFVERTNWVDVLFTAAFLVIYYWMFGQQIRWIAGAK